MIRFYLKRNSKIIYKEKFHGTVPGLSLNSVKHDLPTTGGRQCFYLYEKSELCSLAKNVASLTEPPTSHLNTSNALK